ncbi:hypothetical protein Tco_0810218, partial [Tanacetum coccineum]
KKVNKAKEEEEEDDYTNSEEEEELKKLRKVKIERAREHKKPTKKERKRCKKQMGFEGYINFLIVELSSTLAYHIIDNFHTLSLELRLQKGSIKATRQKVHDILGVPMGNTKLEDLEQRHANDPFIAEWEAQYSHLLKLTPPAIAL